MYFWRNYKQGAGLPVRNFRYHGFSEAFACACRVATGILKTQMLDLLHLFLKKEIEIPKNAEDPSSTFNWVLKLRRNLIWLKENPSDTTQAGRSIGDNFCEKFGSRSNKKLWGKQFVKGLRWIHIDSWRKMLRWPWGVSLRDELSWSSNKLSTCHARPAIGSTYNTTIE